MLGQIRHTKGCVKLGLIGRGARRALLMVRPPQRWPARRETSSSIVKLTAFHPHLTGRGPRNHRDGSQSLRKLPSIGLLPCAGLHDEPSHKIDSCITGRVTAHYVMVDFGAFVISVAAASSGCGRLLSVSPDPKHPVVSLCRTIQSGSIVKQTRQALKKVFGAHACNRIDPEVLYTAQR